MATITVLDSAGATQTVGKYLPGRDAATNSAPVVLSTEDKAALDAVGTKLDTLNGLVGGTDSQLPATLGQKAAAASMSVVLASDQGAVPVSGALTDAQLRATAVPVSGTVNLGSAAADPFGANADAASATGSISAKLRYIAAGTPALGAAAPSASSPVTLPNDVTVGAAASIAALNIDLLTGNASGWYDASNVHSAAIQIIAGAGISAGAIFFEQTNDISAASAGNIWPVEEDTTLTPTPQIAAITIAASTTRMFRGQVTARYVRVRVSTAFVGGNVRAVAVFSQLPYQRLVQTVHQATAGNLNVTATLASTTITSISAGTNAIGDVGVQYRANATGAASVVSVLSPATPATATIKASAGRLLGWHLQNSSAGLRSVKVFNATAPTLGTTTAIFEIDIPAGGSVSLDIAGGIGFATAMTYSVTSAKGLTDNTSTGLAANDVSGLFFYA